jgi:hypothetical protein
MGLDNSPDPLALGLLQAFRGQAEPRAIPPYAANPLFELVVGFHSPKLINNSLAVQQTGRLVACFWSDATRPPSPLFGGGDRVNLNPPRPRMSACWQPTGTDSGPNTFTEISSGGRRRCA